MNITVIMVQKNLKRTDFVRILRYYGVAEDTKSGKGSHTKFWKMIDGKKFSYPVPGDRVVKPCYIRGARKKFKLTAKDNVTDDDFFSR